MSKFTFVYELNDIYSSEVTNKVTLETNATTLHEVLAEFENFLKGAGYSFEGVLDFVNEDESSFYNSDNSNEWPFPLEERPK